MAIRIERDVNYLVLRAVPQMLIKACKHLLHPFLVKGDIGKILIQKQARLPLSLPDNNLTPEHKKTR